MRLVCLLLAFGMITACSSKGDEPDMLELKGVYQLNFPEASGLTYDDASHSLLTVSDDSSLNKQVFRLDLEGNIIEEFSISGYNLEAVAIKPPDNSIWVADEETAYVFPLDDPEAGFVIPAALEGNSGIEGIAYAEQILYILKEKDPSVLFIANPDGTIIDTLSLDFTSDLSDLEYDRANKRLLLLSDQDKKLFILDDSFNPIKSYSLEIEKPEGLAVSSDGSDIYIACDKTSKLYLY